MFKFTAGKVKTGKVPWQISSLYQFWQAHTFSSFSKEPN